MLQEAIQEEINQSAQMQESCFEYIEKQLAHIKQILGTQQASDVDVDYWIDILNNGQVTIATDDSLAVQKGYFVTVFHSDNRTIQFQGPWT
eukprot:10499702-Ditylum_brightwellii.AAC.1